MEISSLGAGGSAPPPVTLCVEAPQWQPALQKARVLRGDEGALSNFSIELLDDGYRAIDPSKRLRYVVRKAPADTPLSPGASAAAAPKAPDAGAKKPRVGAETAELTSTGRVIAPEPKAVSAAALKAAKSPAEAPAPGVEQPKNPQLGQTVSFSSSGSAAVRAEAEALAKNKTPAPPRPVSSPSNASVAAPSAPPVPSYRVLSSREENPTERAPLTYREYVYVVPEGTSEESARRLLLERFEGVRTSLQSAPTGKLVNLAVFDHAFQGRPQRRPIVTLTWKDWRGEPEVTFPGRPAGYVPQAAPVQSAPAATSAPTTSAPTTSSPPATAVPSTAKSATYSAPAPKPAAPAAPKPAAPAAPAAPKAAAPAAPKAAAPAAPKPAAPPAAAPAAAAKPASLRPPKPRATGEELLTELFEACADLGFLSDPLEGADFVLALAMEKIPSELCLVSLFDIDKKEFFVVRQSGGKTQCLGATLSEKSGLAQAAMRAKRAVVIPDAVRDPRATDARWKAIGIEPKSIACAPVEAGGRYLGLIELVNPEGASRYGASEENALTYIGQQLAEFLAGQSAPVDRAKLLASASKEAR
ncbi:GAF domain-containing protein [Polyangium aurulentum]|uniref:GAF domain-containing protein n=1 Tax=Polyangium aurulentum TaxID=2567896 RepID=UPI001F3CDB43|nr:GAF domain-containing protein [Polyangium aurulentum]